MIAPELLDGCAKALSLGSFAWHDFVMVRNVGPVFGEPLGDTDNISNRGFNAIIVDRRAGPTHFLKVRSALYSRFEREAAVTVALARHVETRGMVPAAEAFCVGPVRVLAQQYVRGPTLEALVRADRRRWQRQAAEILGRARPVLRALAEVVAVSPPPDLGAALLADLDLLETLGLELNAAKVYRAELSMHALSGAVQHGDFWPRNVVHTPDGWRLFDFESGGEVRLALYDCFHMIRGCAEAAGIADWLRALARSASEGGALVDAVREARGSRDAASTVAALVAYLIDFVSRLHRRGVARERTSGRIRELNRLPALLASGPLRRALQF